MDHRTRHHRHRAPARLHRRHQRRRDWAARSPRRESAWSGAPRWATMPAAIRDAVAAALAAPDRAHDRRAGPHRGRRDQEGRSPSCSGCRSSSTKRSGKRLVERFARIGRVPAPRQSLSGRGAARRDRAAQPLGHRARPLARRPARARDHAARRAVRDAGPCSSHEVLPRLVAAGQRRGRPLAHRSAPPGSPSPPSPSGWVRSKRNWHRSPWPTSRARRGGPSPHRVESAGRRRPTRGWHGRDSCFAHRAGESVYGEDETDLAAVVLDARPRAGPQAGHRRSRAPAVWSGRGSPRSRGAPMSSSAGSSLRRTG